MKFLFCFLSLLLCLQLQVQCMNSTVTRALISRLKVLSGHAISPLSEVNVPSPKMQQHSECCVPEFKKVLNETLSSVTIPETHEHLRDEILDTLDHLHDPAKGCRVEEVCTTAKKTDNKDLFKPHVDYLRKMNRNRRSRL